MNAHHWQNHIEQECDVVLAELKTGGRISALAHQWSYDDVIQSLFQSAEMDTVITDMKLATTPEAHALANDRYLELLSEHEDKVSYLIASERVRHNHQLITSISL